MFGQGQAGGIDVNQLVLISIKRITTGTWVPVIRLVNSKWVLSLESSSFG